MDRRTLFAVLACFLIVVFWQQKYAPPPVAQVAQQAPTTQAEAPTSASKAEPQTEALAAKPAIKTVSPAQKTQTPPSEPITVKLAGGEVTFGVGNQLIDRWVLSEYVEKLEGGTQRQVELQNVVHEPGAVLFGFDNPELKYLNDVKGVLTQRGNQVIWNYSDSNIDLSRTITIDDTKAYFDVVYSAKLNASAKAAFVSLVSKRPGESDEEELDRQLSFFGDQKVERFMLNSEITTQGFQRRVKWISTWARYFGVAVVSTGEYLPFAVIQPVQTLQALGGRLSLSYPLSGNQIEIPVRVYFGPKKLETLREMERSLDVAVDFGWFTIIAYPILQLLRWLYQYFHNYGIAIIIVTLLLKLVTYPLTYKSMKSMKQMARLQPEITKLREKFGKDPQRMNQEMLQFMKRNGYNPMSGCFPILIQMPVFIALYNVLRTAVELYQAPFGLWITDLSIKDPYFVTPLLLTATMYIKQKMTPMTATDPMQHKMFQYMPLIFGLLMLTLPSGLTLYMLTNAVAGIFQQMILNKKFDAEQRRPVVMST